MTTAPVRLALLCLVLTACAAPRPQAAASIEHPAYGSDLLLPSAVALAPEVAGAGAAADDAGTALDAGDATDTAAPPLSQTLAAELAPERSYDLAPRRQTAYRGRGIPYEPGIFNFTIGSRWFEDSRWGVLDNQLAIGLDYTIKKPDAWIGLNFGVVGSWDEARIGATYIDSWLVEGYLGPRAFLQLPGAPIYGYAGVGVSLAYSEIDRIGLTRFSDTVFGGSANVGVMFQLNRQQALGVEWRTLQFTDIDADAFGGPSDVNYQQVSLVFSAAF